MPFIDGRFYINPAYGRALERARGADGIWSEQFPEFAEPALQEQDFWSGGAPSSWAALNSVPTCLSQQTHRSIEIEIL